MITTSKVITKRPENAVSRIFCNALDNIIYILNDPCIGVRNLLQSPTVSYKPMCNLTIDPVRNPVEPNTQQGGHEYTNWCQRRMYTMDQSFPNLQTNFITRDSDILHWFQFLKFTNQENTLPGTKNRKILSKWWQ